MSLRRILPTAFIGVLLLATPASSQIPDRFTNLQVLPTDMPRDSLLTLMRSFSFGLGQRCVYCHVGEDSPTLAGVDFASDDRPQKGKAREMLRMVQEINDRIASNGRFTNPLRVACATCHRGIARPVALEDTIHHVAVALGGAAATATYDSLRIGYYGRSAFDFGPRTLVRVAERLYAQSRFADAIVVLEKNREFFPRAWDTNFWLGRSHESLGNRDAAVAAYRRTLESLPGHEASQLRLNALTGG